MKKRLLSALLALALVFVLLPTTALAEVTTENDYDISINGKGWKFERDNTSGAYIPAYYYHTNEFSADENYRKLYTNDNLMLTKEGNTVTITIRRGTSHDHGNYSPITFTLKKESTKKNDVPCIEMGNDNNLVITGNGTLNITRNESKSYGAALYSNVGDITINGGITVNVSFLNGKDYYNKNASSNAIYVGDNHNLTVSGSGTNVTATNQGFDSSPATVCVEGGTITVSGGASLSATNTYADNFSGSSVTQHFKSYAISGTESKPCTLIVADEKSSVTAWAYDEKYGKPFGFVTYNITGATVKAGSNAYYATETNIDNINGKEYVKISVPALETTADVLIAKENAVVGVRTSLGEGNGYYTYNKDTKTLTLEDVSITNVAHFIQFWAKDSYTIELKGTNTITGVTSAIRVPEKGYNNESLDGLNVTITGTGSLNVTANTYAIDMQVGNLIFNSTGNITLTTNTNYTVQKTVCNALHVAGSITIDNTKYDIVGARQEKNYPTETISDSSVFDPDYLNGYTVGGETTLFKTITITPAAAKDSTISYDGTTLKQGETITDRNGGTATVDSENNTITLKNFNGTALSFDATLADSTLVLEGTNTLSSIVTTQKGLTISGSGSGSGSLTVDSIRVPNNTQHTANLTINGATVTVGTAELTTRAIDVNGSLTVTGATLTATSNSDNVPTVQVGGNASFTGSTVTITNNSTALHKDAADNIKGDSVSSALYVKGNINTDNANVTAKVENGGGNAIGALGDITVNGSTVTAVNKGQKFTTIIAKNVYVSGNSEITSNNLNKNPPYHGSYLACPAIEGNIVNKNTDYSLKFEGEHSSSSEPKTTLAPGEQTTLYYYNVTITRGDEVARTESPVVIAGTTLRNDTYYTITDGSTVVANGSKSNYNAIYDSANKTLKLNNAKISTTTKNAAIKISEDLTITTITVTGTNELEGNYNHCIESWSNFTINGTGRLVMTNGSNTAASVIYCGPGKSLTIAAEVIIKNEARPGNLIFTVEENAYSFAEGYNVYASTSVSGSPLETYDAAKSSTYQYLRVTKENLAPTTPTTYTVTITAGDNMKCESGALTQEVTKGAAITEVKFMAASGHYFPADYVSKMNLPAGLTAEIRENSWYLIISGTPTSDVTINLPAASVRPTITVSMPTPAAGNTPATANDITLTYSDINKSISKNLTISNVVWQSYVPNGDGSITPGEVLSSGDKFEAGKTYFVRITHEYVAGEYDIVPAAGITLDYTESDSTYMMLLFYTTGAPCNHEYTNDWYANGNTHWHECKLCRAHADEVAHTFGDWITDTPATDTTDGSKHRTCSVCQYQENATIPKTGTGEIVPPTPDNPGTIVIIRPAEEEKPAQQPNPSTGANDLVGLAVAAAVAAALGSAALLRKHD